MPGGAPAQERYLPGGGVYLPEGCTWSRGRCTYGGVPAQVLPLWTEFLTHASENITLPQTLFAGGNNRLLPQIQGLASPRPSGNPKPHAFHWVMHQIVSNRGHNASCSVMNQIGLSAKRSRDT